jgi:hypothetical protein
MPPSHEIWQFHMLQMAAAMIAQEQVTIFLYTCVTGLSSHHVTEHFQHSHTMTQKYVHTIARYSLTHMLHQISIK